MAVLAAQVMWSSQIFTSRVISFIRDFSMITISFVLTVPLVYCTFTGLFADNELCYEKLTDEYENFSLTLEYL